MIEISDLSRHYGDVVAVDRVSCRIGKGEVVGLLGHNGAGKTTIMKMVTGFLEPTAGDIRIDGRDLREHRRDIQREIGYLPENCPVYPEMNVAEFLEYRATLLGVPESDRPGAMRRAMEQTGLLERALVSIGTLSRGFRQRVGVAQAILHKPRIVILDEPTNGLDPDQIQQMRSLILRLAESATVILSTHILQEVEAVCERVLMMRRGKLALDSRLDELGDSDRLLVSVSGEENQVRDVLSSMEGISDVEKLPGAHDWRLRLADADHQKEAARVGRALIEKGLSLYRLQPDEHNLETIFRQVTETGSREVAHA